MILVLHLCAPEGEALRREYADAMNAVREDNLYVVDAMLNAGMDVPTTVGEAGLVYAPDQHVNDPRTGEPISHIRGMRKMFESGKFSCQDAAPYEASVLERKHGIPAMCICVKTDLSDFHGIVVTLEGAYDPVLNWQRGGVGVAKRNPFRTAMAAGQSLGCRIEEGRVLCDLPGRDCVDERGRWRGGPRAGQVEPIVSTRCAPDGSCYGVTKDGVAVPMCAAGGRR